jgi:5-methyltetrahydrofolate--homocysteine methyltransferase
MVETLVKAGADLIGANCGNGIADMIGIVEEIRIANSVIPVLVHANAGMPHYHDGQTVFPETPDEMAVLVPKIIAAGANIVGGCCGTTPGHIWRVREAVDKI